MNISSAKYIPWPLFCFLGGMALAAEDSGFTEEQLKWLESDSEHPALEVNEGELVFLDSKPSKPEHHHQNEIWITKDSIKNGWARLDQCHTNLDAVPTLAIVYNKDKVRDIRILSTKNIASAEVIGHKVLLKNISRGSKICLEAWSNLIKPVDNTHFMVQNGPFMRRFLDGYYPITVTLNIHYPDNRLELLEIEPALQSGWNIRRLKNEVRMKGRFEGRLKTRLLFKKRTEAP